MESGKEKNMRKPKDEPEQLAVLAVLSAAAREAEELLAHDDDLERGTIEEANRRLKVLMRAARLIAR